MYNHYMHYGDSMTYGVDSGGDGIDDPDGTYPTYLESLTKIKHTNRANPGASLEQMAFKLLNDLEQDLVPENTLVLINLPPIARFVSSTFKWHMERVRGKRYTYGNISVHTPYLDWLNTTDHQNHPAKFISKAIFECESEWILWLKYFHTLNSMVYSLEKKSIDYVIVDLLANIRDLWDMFTLNYQDLIITNSEGIGLLVEVRKDLLQYRTKSGHYTKQGYELLADTVYENLVNIGKVK